MRILVVDIGDAHVRLLATGRRTPVRLPAGSGLRPADAVKMVKAAAAAWHYDAVSIGYPGLVVHGRTAGEAPALGAGWVGFDFDKAFGKPVKVVNDVAMHALGSYQGGRLLYLGLGANLRSAAIVDGAIETMELGHLPYRKGRTYGDYLGARGLKRLGRRKWRKHVLEVAGRLKTALQADDVVIGGGRSRSGDDWPAGVRMAAPAQTFRGGYRLWQDQ
jgi:predicted NBD/HSP70 family sugar kinase